MTYQPSHADFAADRNHEAREFASLRNDCIEAFAELEISICQCIVRFDCSLDAKKAPLSQRLSALAKAKPSPHLSSDRAKRLAPLTQSCERLLTLRGSMVHGKMTIGILAEEPVAMFQNAADAAVDLPIYLTLSPERFAKVAAEARKLAKDFRSYLSQPSASPSSKGPAATHEG